MKKLILILLFVVSAPFSQVHAQDDIEARAWNAGAVIIETDHSYGQGYVSRVSGGGLGVTTIHHVIDGERYVWITIPGFVERSRVATSRFICEERRGDRDTACTITLHDEATDSLLASDSPVVPYIRRFSPTQLEIGQLVGSPRPDTGRWTLYVVSDIQDDFIELRAVFFDIDGDGQGDPEAPAGNFCHGRSGGPVVLVELTRSGQVSPLLTSGYPVSVGELEQGVGRARPDYIDPSNTCYYTVKVNRPS